MADELNLDSELAWPDGDDPYKLTPGARHLIACLNFTHDEPWYGIAEGFKRIADLAVAQVEQTGHEADYYVYPVLFCYRHYLEVMLKQLLRDARRLDDVDDTIPGTHSLIVLWDKLEPLLLKHTPDPATYANVCASLARFDELDPRSDSYRYPVDKKGAPQLEGIYNVDLGQVRAVVERLAGFLDGASTAVQVDLDAKHEMAQWHGP